MKSMPVSIWLPGNKWQCHRAHTAAVVYSMAGWAHSPQGHQSPPGRRKRHCFLTVQWVNSLLPIKSQVSITEGWPASPISVFPTSIFRQEMLKWSYLSCQPLLDFSSFFLLCLIIPFCERWKQKKGKTKKQVETFSSLARTCAQIWTFLGATGVTGRMPDKWHFFPYHCTLPVTAQETMVSLFHRNTCRGKFGRHHSLVLLGPFLC